MRMNLKLASLMVVALLTAIPYAKADVTVNVDPNAAWGGFMNVFELDQTTGAFSTGWGFDDLYAPLAGSPFQGGEFVLAPTPISTDDDFWYGATAGGGAGPRVGNKFMDANGFVQVDDLFGGMDVTFEGAVIENTFTEHQAFVFIRDFAPDFSSFTETIQELTGPGGFSITHTTSADAGRHVQYGFTVQGANVWPDDAANFGTMRLTAVPEPGSIAVLSMGLVGLILRRRR